MFCAALIYFDYEFVLTTPCATSPLVNPITRSIGVFLREILFASGVAAFSDSESLCDCENNVVDIIERRLIKLASRRNRQAGDERTHTPSCSDPLKEIRHATFRFDPFSVAADLRYRQG